MKKKNWFKFVFVNSLTLPIRLLSAIWAIVLIVHIRSAHSAKKAFLFIERHEKAKKLPNQKGR